MYTLIGSYTSPYVRRLRLYLEGIDYKLETVNYLDSKDDAKLASVNPIKRIPVLIVHNQALWESRIIYQYLQKALGKTPLSLAEENIVSAIDAWQDQLIQMFLMRRMGQAIEVNSGYFQRHAQRQEQLSNYLSARLKEGELRRWDYPAMSLFCLLDWAVFREQIKLADLPPDFSRFMDEIRIKPIAVATDPRRV